MGLIMFTGIVDHCGTITSVQKTEKSIGLHIACQFDDLQLGESIAVDGICLTVTQFGAGYFECDLSPETCSITTASHFQPGAGVNLERALRLRDRLGGHIVQGHVDHVACLAERSTDGEYLKLVFTGFTDADTMRRLLIKKGSVAVNGVSLTINRVNSAGFEAMLVPHTLQRTNLGELKIGDAVNIEYDWLAKVITHQLQQQYSSLL
jgi:riboflavin synthase